MRVPLSERGVDLLRLVASLGKANRLAESGVTRYWYQEISHATVITISWLTPESG